MFFHFHNLTRRVTVLCSGVWWVYLAWVNIIHFRLKFTYNKYYGSLFLPKKSKKQTQIEKFTISKSWVLSYHLIIFNILIIFEIIQYFLPFFDNWQCVETETWIERRMSQLCGIHLNLIVSFYLLMSWIMKLELLTEKHTI